MAYFKDQAENFNRNDSLFLANFVTSDTATPFLKKKHYDLRSFHNDNPTVPWTMNDMRLWNVYYFAGKSMDFFGQRRSIAGRTFRRHVMDDFSIAGVGTSSYQTMTQMNVQSMGSLDFNIAASGNEEWPLTDANVTYGKNVAYNYANTMQIAVPSAGETVVSKYNDDILTDFTDDTYVIEMALPNFPSQAGITTSGTPLTIASSVITDATRTTNTSGDGLPVDSSVGIWETTTNLLPNGGFETNTNTWDFDGGGTVTVSRDATTSKFGVASAKTILDGTAGSQGIRIAGTSNFIASTPGSTYTASLWIKGSGTVNLYIAWWDTAGTTFINEADLTGIALTSNWQRVTLTGVAGTGGNKMNIGVRTAAAQAITFWIDGAQLEQKASSTPYVHTDGSSITRTAGQVQLPTSYINATQGWIAMRMRMEVPTNATSAHKKAWALNIDANNLMEGYYWPLTNAWIFRNISAGTSVLSLSSTDLYTVGNLRTVIWKWDAANVYVSVNGANFIGISRAAPPVGSLPALLDIGSTAGTLQLNSEVLWFACGTGTLSDADAGTINGFGSTDPTWTTFPTASQTTLVAPMNTSQTTVPGTGTLNLNNSYIDFSSDQGFASGATDSVAFSESTNDLSAGGNTYFSIPRTRLIHSTLSNLQAIRYRLNNVAGLTANITLMSMRLLPAAATFGAVDIDTKKGSFTRYVPRTGTPDTTMTTTPIFFGNAPKNTVVYYKFNSGHNPIGNDNILRTYFRHEASGDQISVELYSRSTQSRLRIYQTISGVTTEIFSTPINTNILTNEIDYTLCISLIEQTINASLYTIDGVFLRTLAYTTGDQAVTRLGRGYNGFSFEPYNYDFDLLEIGTDSLEYGNFESTPFSSLTPVSGATLLARASRPEDMLADTNLVANGDSIVTGTNILEIVRDGTQWIGGLITQDPFTVGNPSLLNIEGEIFISNLRGLFQLALVDENKSVGWISNLDNLVANRWNSFSVPISELNVPPQQFFLYIHQAGFYPDTFQIRNIRMNYESIVWNASVDSGTTWQPFLNAINSEFSGIKFATVGTKLKVRGTARSDKAWIAGYELKPHYRWPGQINP